MDTLVKADIFFFISTIAVVVLTVILSIIMIYLISILHYLRNISQIAKDQAEVISEDIDDLRSEIRTKGASVSSIFDFLGHLTRKRVTHKRKKNN